MNATRLRSALPAVVRPKPLCLRVSPSVRAIHHAALRLPGRSSFAADRHSAKPSNPLMRPPRPAAEPQIAGEARETPDLGSGDRPHGSFGVCEGVHRAGSRSSMAGRQHTFVAT